MEDVTYEPLEQDHLGGNPEEAAAYHNHNGRNSPKIAKESFQALPFSYYSNEFDNGTVTTAATIDWTKGNVQYVTLSGNTTFTFKGNFPGARCILHVAGAFTPTFPASVRWPANTTPSATASAGHKDIYSFVYSGKEKLWDGVQSANFPIT